MEPTALFSHKYPIREYQEDKLSVINELTREDISILKTRRQAGEDLLQILVTEYGAKTFCIQTDYDWMFGNETWNELFLYYKKAEKRIKQDWDGRGDEPKDKSYISIYKFSDLPNFSDRRYASEIISLIS